MTEVSEATIRDLIVAINRLCDLIGGARSVPINGTTKRLRRDPTAAERARRYRDRLRYRAMNGEDESDNIGVTPIERKDP